MKYIKYIAGFVLGFVLLVPSVSSAATLTSFQINSIIGLLQAFNVDAVTIALVRTQLVVSTTTPQDKIEPATTTPQILPIYQNNFFGSMTAPVQATAKQTNQPLLLFSKHRRSLNGKMRQTAFRLVRCSSKCAYSMRKAQL